MEKTTENSYAWLLLYFVLFTVKMIYKIGAIFWTIMGAVIVAKMLEGWTGILLALCTLNWLGWVSYVALQQMEFTLDKLLVTGDTDGK